MLSAMALRVHPTMRPSVPSCGHLLTVLGGSGQYSELYRLPGLESHSWNMRGCPSCWACEHRLCGSCLREPLGWGSVHRGGPME